MALMPHPHWASRNTGTGSIHSWHDGHHLIVNDTDVGWQWLVFTPGQDYRDSATSYGIDASIEGAKIKATEALHVLLHGA